MRKYLFFAFAFVASVLALTSCEKKDKVENPLVGTWKYSVDAGWSMIHYTYVFDETNYSFTDKNNVDTQIKKGTYELNQTECTGVLHQKTVTMIDGHTNGTSPMEEDIRFKYVIDGNTLTITEGLDWERPFVITLTKE